MRAALDVTNFVDYTWLSQNGIILGDAMHVIEKLTHEDNVIFCEISIEDPRSSPAPGNSAAT